jgi:hypothetical protein
MPLIPYVLSELAHTQLDWNTPSGRYAAVATLVSIVLVYFKRNQPVTP